MALYDDPPHRCALYSSTAANDAGGGTGISYTLEQTDIACEINTASANTRLLFAQQNIAVTETVSILSSELTTTPQPGWKAVALDAGKDFIIRGIRSGREIGTIPPLTYLDCEELL